MLGMVPRNRHIILRRLAVAGFSSFWAIVELFEQENRVLKGWFPENPDRHDYYEMKRQVNNINKKI